MTSTRVSVIIPTYNGLKMLRQHMTAVLANLHHEDEVIIIDDAGTDDTESWFQQTYRGYNKEGITVGFYSSGEMNIRMVYLKNADNLRFGLTVNRAVEQAQHNVLWLLNNDVEPHMGCLDQLIWCFNEPDIFAVGCLELESSETASDSAHQPKNVSVPEGKVAGGKNQLFFKQGLFQHQRALDFSTGPTAWVSGGSGLFDKEKWLILRGFDPIYSPAYWEDIDLCRRAQLQGWKTLFCAKAVVDHNHESTHRDVFGQKELLRISWRNADLFTRRHATGWQMFWFHVWRPIWWWRRQTALSKLEQ